MAKLFYKSLIKLAQLRLIVVVVNVNLYDHSILVQIPGKYNRFKILNDKRRRKMATNDTYNFYDQSRLVRIDHVDNFNELINFTRNQASQDDVCEADFGEVVEENSDTDDKSKEEVAKVTVIPQELSTPQGIGWLHKMQDAGVLDENYQPASQLTVAQMGCLVMKAQFELNLSSCWKDFSLLWNINREKLRMGFVNGQNTKQTIEYNKKISKY